MVQRKTGEDVKDYSKDEILNALKESIKLQRHYAYLLNMHDGGRRRLFENYEEWIERLRETKED